MYILTDNKHKESYCLSVLHWQLCYFIKQLSHSKYLGVTIDEGLTWNNHILMVVNKAIDKLRRNFNQCPPYVKCNLYKSMVQPIIESASPVWKPHTVFKH